MYSISLIVTKPFNIASLASGSPISNLIIIKLSITRIYIKLFIITIVIIYIIHNSIKLSDLE
nr:MAG TPA: hypothetical protein [Caudoviricetes sp.]